MNDERDRRWLSRVPRRRHPDHDDQQLPDQAPAPIASSSIPVVPSVPIRCPRCGSRSNRNQGVHQVAGVRRGYHICSDCDQKFHSAEIELA